MPSCCGVAVAGAPGKAAAPGRSGVDGGKAGDGVPVVGAGVPPMPLKPFMGHAAAELWFAMLCNN